jgi:hypothetical protein
MPNAAHGVRSEPALAVLPGPEAGLAVTAFEEPEPTEGSMAEGSQGPLLREVPFHCVAEARKPPAVNGAPSSGPWRRPRGSLVGRHTNFY